MFSLPRLCVRKFGNKGLRLYASDAKAKKIGLVGMGSVGMIGLEKPTAAINSFTIVDM